MTYSVTVYWRLYSFIIFCKMWLVWRFAALIVWRWRSLCPSIRCSTHSSLLQLWFFVIERIIIFNYSLLYRLRILINGTLLRLSEIFCTEISKNWLRAHSRWCRDVVFYSLFTIRNRCNELCVVCWGDTSNRCHLSYVSCAGHITAYNWNRELRTIQKWFRFTIISIQPISSLGAKFTN